MKKILSLILALVMMLSIVACDNDKDKTDDDGNKTDGKTSYTVTVLDSDGNPIAGAKVTFSPKGGTEVPFTTDAEGKVGYKTDKELTATVTEIPKGYEYDKLNVAQNFSADGTLTVTVSKRAPFVVKVVDQDGNPVAGVLLQVCNDSTCVPMPKTDDNGESSKSGLEGDYAAKITNLPEGYIVEGDESLKTYYDLVDNKVTITVTKL